MARAVWLDALNVIVGTSENRMGVYVDSGRGVGDTAPPEEYVRVVVQGRFSTSCIKTA